MENTYMGDDGFLRCSICHQRVERMANIPELGIFNRKVRCICSCGEKEIEARKERERQEDRERQRKICFQKSNMAKWNFQNDDRRNEKISDAMMNYVKQFKDFKAEGKGLLLFGPVGTGKTYYGACIANALIDMDYRVLMTNFSQISNALLNTWEKQAYIDNLANRYDLLILDDLGEERATEFMNETVFQVIDARYRAGLPLIVTTNLEADQLQNPKEISYQRVYDRILERSIPILVDGESRRKLKLRDTVQESKRKLGL